MNACSLQNLSWPFSIDHCRYVEQQTLPRKRSTWWNMHAALSVCHRSVSHMRVDWNKWTVACLFLCWRNHLKIRYHHFLPLCCCCCCWTDYYLRQWESKINPNQLWLHLELKNNFLCRLQNMCFGALLKSNDRCLILLPYFIQSLSNSSTSTVVEEKNILRYLKKN